MRKEIRKFIPSEHMVLQFARDPDKDIISQWKDCISFFRLATHAIIFNIVRHSPFQGLTRFVYRLAGMKIGKQVGFAASHMDIIFPEGITIGDNSSIGWKTHLLTHEFTQDHVRLSKIQIGQNVLVGAFSVVRGGVSIGDNAIIAMNSFVNKDIPADEVWGGVPAKKIGTRKEYPKIHPNYKSR